MGHAINYLEFKGTTDKHMISAICNDKAKENSDYHSNLLRPIQFLDKVFNSYDEAIAYLGALDTGDYAQYAVQYRLIDYKVSKKLSDKQSKYNELYNKYLALKNAQHYTVATVKSEHIGCKKCSSRLAVKYLKGNNCPLCGQELRPVTVLDRIATMEKNVIALEKELKALRVEETARAASRTKNCATKWLVRIEYHV